MKTGYSQNDEEEAIRAFFDARPTTVKRLLDIGAHDGVSNSNTRWLTQNGWGGTMVEPSPTVFYKLMELYRGRADINLVNVAVVPTVSRLMKFHDSQGDMISTVDDAHRELWTKAHNVPYQSIYVSGITDADLMLALPGPYTFVNLDVEGINYELFKELPLRQFETQLICVEYQDKLAEIEAHASMQGYKRFHLTGENVILAAQ